MGKKSEKKQAIEKHKSWESKLFFLNNKWMKTNIKKNIFLYQRDLCVSKETFWVLFDKKSGYISDDQLYSKKRYVLDNKADTDEVCRVKLVKVGKQS